MNYYPYIFTFYRLRNASAYRRVPYALIQFLPSQQTFTYLLMPLSTGNGRSQCSTPAHPFGLMRVDTRHPLMALNPQASRSIARHQEVFVACLRSWTVEEPNIPVNWEDNPVLISYTLAQQFRGWKCEQTRRPLLWLLCGEGATGKLSSYAMIFFLQWPAD